MEALSFNDPFKKHISYLLIFGEMLNLHKRA